MKYKVIINNQVSDSYLNKLSNSLSNKLNNNGISNYVIDSNILDEKTNIINNIIDNNSIIISNDLSNNNIEIIYSIQNNDNLVSRIANNLENNDIVVDKYYQRRDSSNTNYDYDNIIREINNGESIIIKHNKNNDISIISDILVNTIKSYLGVANDYYIVKKGDNLYSIARKFNTTVDTIKKLNNLYDNNLSIGQKLIIKSLPSINNTVSGNTYKVVNGDTLYSIARKFNISVSDLKKINNLTSDTISIGQILSIPKDNNIEYIVKKGDTLYGISKRYNVSIKDIMNLNNLKNTNLSINQKLVIPKI